MTAYIIHLMTGDWGSFSWDPLCYCPDEETSKTALSLLQKDYEKALELWKEAVVSGSSYAGTDPVASRVIPTRVQTVPMYYSCLYDGFDLVVEEVPEWESKA